MASFRKRYGKWNVRIRGANHKTITKTFLQKDDAIKYARETEAKIQRGTFEDLEQASQTTLKELLVQYRDEETSKKKNNGPEIYKINKLIRHKIAERRLSKLTVLSIRKFRDELANVLGPSTVNKYITIISVAIKFARQTLAIYMPHNPCEYIKRLKEPEFQSDVITEEEEERLLNNCRKSKATWLALSIMLGIDCGLRRGEILNLKRSDINFQKATCLLRDTKNGTSRCVGLSPRVIQEMLKQPAHIDGRLINCSTKDQFQFYWQQCKRWSEVDKTFHSTRHTFASRLAMKGWTIQEISAQGGWKELKILKRYTHIRPEHLANKLKEQK
jgi:integrase|tara:strand:+ start:306 stop:1295 length:990 start_codon:yes stop_codon:yes gene_type:complete